MFRSYLFTPGDSERKLGKCLEAGADAIILDLEDSVGSRNKDLARKLVVEFIKTHSQHREQTWVRLNALDTEDFARDLAALKDAPPMGVVLPKSDSLESVRDVSDALDAVESVNKMPVGSLKILAIATETAAGVLNMASYQAGHPRLAGLTWGAEDLAAALSAFSNKDDAGNYFHPYVLARSLCLLAAASAGVAAVDGVDTNFRDLNTLEVETKAARREGFFGRLAIHPAQVPVINQAFIPTDEEVTWAEKVVQMFADDAVGVTQIDGKMVDIPHFTQAKKILAIVERFSA